MRSQFWTALGRYLSPIVSADGRPVNWINYKTGVKGIQFRMEATFTESTLALVISGAPEEVVKKLRLFDRLHTITDKYLAKDWQWENASTAETRMVTTLAGVNFMRKEDWPAMITFFKAHLLALDAFWCEAKLFFEAS